jgi:succinate dehydrogenase flavin-adding protein (antitoxin of CptAB toxin-antitoxin module)
MLKRIVDFYNKYKIYPEIDSSNTFNFYKDVEGDITSVFFSEKNEINTTINEFVDFLHTKDSQMWRYDELDKNLEPFIERYFSLSKKVLETSENMIKEYDLDMSKTISVCYRGNDKHKETNIPTYNEMLKKIKEVRQKFPEHKLLIQSDEVEFYNFLNSIYPDMIYFKEVAKINSNKNLAIQYVIPKGKRTQQALLFLAICNILSKSSKLIINSGNVALWISLYRNSFDGVYQYLNPKEYVYGVKNPDFGVISNFWIEK